MAFDKGKYKEKRPLMPDTIMIYNGKYYVLMQSAINMDGREFQIICQMVLQ